jgi:chromosome segregation ATPase
MKKFIVTLLTLSLIMGMSTVAFAEGDSKASPAALTSEQKQAREAYLTVHFEDMNQLVALRKQTEEARDANNATSKLIQEKLKAQTTLNKDSITKLKDLTSQRKTLVAQAKQIHVQRLALREQYKVAVKAKDVEKMKSIETQILALNKQISDIKVKDEALKAQITPLQEQLKGLRDANKQLKEVIKNQLQQAKTIGETIKAQEQEKTQLWNTYKENINNKDYTAAGITFKAIIAKKTAILNNITQRGTILNQVLASIK